jgi:hypothetical protein
MFVIVAVNLSVTLKADRNCIVYAVRPTVRFGHDVIRLNFYAAKTVTYATSPVASLQ